MSLNLIKLLFGTPKLEVDGLACVYSTMMYSDFTVEYVNEIKKKIRKFLNESVTYRSFYQFILYDNMKKREFKKKIFFQPILCLYKLWLILLRNFFSHISIRISYSLYKPSSISPGDFRYFINICFLLSKRLYVLKYC